MATKRMATGARQREVLAFVRDYLASHAGRAPTVREIAAGIGVSSTCTVAYHVRKLIRAGLLAQEPRTARSLRLPDQQGPAGKRGAHHA